MKVNMFEEPCAPPSGDSKYLTAIQLDEGLEDLMEAKQLEKRMGFKYCQAIGEVTYALMICRVDISPAVITLSKHSARPTKVHYEAVKRLFEYLYATKKHGLTYWRPCPKEELPDIEHPGKVSGVKELEKY